MSVGRGRRGWKKYPAERKACTRLNRSGSPRIDYISRWLLDKRTFGERVGESEWERGKGRERERVTESSERGMSWQSVQRRGEGARKTGERERKTQDLFDTWWITARENRRIFFPFSFFPSDRFPRENGPGKWRLQVETFVRKDRTLQSCLLASMHRVTSIWVLLMWEMATQEFKFRNYFRTFGVAAHVKPEDEKGLSVDKK